MNSRRSFDHLVGAGDRSMMKDVSPLAAHSAMPLSKPSPDGNGDRQCERGDHKAEVDPSPVSLCRLGKHEKMDHDPHTHREPQSKPNQIAGGLVYSPDGFALGTAS